ncbi:MAG: hypothetical protein R3220_05720 [Balneolaceae bacterium]|nr:hypothetical protein [Balneolaceae bacterium]
MTRSLSTLGDRNIKNNPRAFLGKGIPSQTPEQKELAALKKELADVRMERDILKKAMGIFTKKTGDLRVYGRTQEHISLSGHVRSIRGTRKRLLQLDEPWSL